ncbi:MAG: type II secretion system protein [Candidatus Margulisiibacteriota bacterium]|jgi:type II secretory pathway pseudopilin PulG
MKQKTIKSHGFILIELLIALVLFTIIISFSALFFKSFSTNLKTALNIKKELYQAENDLETVLSGQTHFLPSTPYESSIKKTTININQNYKLELLFYEN